MKLLIRPPITQLELDGPLSWIETSVGGLKDSLRPVSEQSQEELQELADFLSEEGFTTRTLALSTAEEAKDFIDNLSPPEREGLLQVLVDLLGDRSGTGLEPMEIDKRDGPYSAHNILAGMQHMLLRAGVESSLSEEDTKQLIGMATNYLTLIKGNP